jgi:quinol monooxygenase YgiN
MKFGSAMLIAGAMMITAAPAGAQAPTDPNYYSVTYLEVTPASEGEAVNLIKQVAAASRKEPGNLRFDVLQRVDRKNQFAILEAWSDQKAISVTAGAAPAGKGAVYVITHVDVTPNFKDATIDMLKAFAEGTRKEPGAERYEVLQQNNRANHFTVTEIWKDQAALTNHTVTGPAKEFREKLGPMSGALYDDRRYSSIE